MSLEITAGPADIDDAADPDLLETVAAAESVLSGRFGAAVRLADPERLGGAGRSVVVRVRVASTPFSLPRTLVVKRYPSAVADRDPFAHEAVSHKLLTALPGEDRLTPELVAQDNRERLVVLEDLGRAPRLAEKLLGPDARAAERGLLSWAHAMGRLHATTAGRDADFDALMRRQGSQCCADPIAVDVHAALAGLPELLAGALGVRTAPAVLDFAVRAARGFGTARWRAFSPSTSCPDNHLVTSRGVRFLDFEGGCVRDVVFDAACLRVPFPSCWCAYGLPAGMSEAMVAAWRAEVGSVWPDLDDDAVFLPRLLQAQLLWVWLATWRGLPGLDSALPSGHRPLDSPPRSTVLTTRWLRLRSDALALGEEQVAEHAGAMVSALVARYGPQAAELPLYPAFR
ncbi:hypothetical protein [Saccharothrix algeriensis]|uniref:Aminoglycoside phosphotransferase domain-containing protein n=1 Tax=Saccharothrix algeriensis TaxID=173560 RepID=A0A8T8I134_9PSEU|nr:hypothetical protein [Saccharothrix algeriensis]MBM7810215.1 hypothetical protein [Saccharothrix algeriensis]QTR04387.1 hypothetical protein J7S33_05665 [Saccharothrix algeriensis]